MKPEDLVKLADEIDGRIGPIPGRTADLLAVILRKCARELERFQEFGTLAATLDRLNARAPWRLCEEVPGVILSADGGEVCNADSRVTNDESSELAEWIVAAINALALGSEK